MPTRSSTAPAFLAAIVAASIALAACGPSAAPIATRAAIVSPSPAPAPQRDPTVDPAATVNLLAHDLDFDRALIEVPANVPFAIRFRNVESSQVPHDVDIRQLDGIVTVRNQQPIGGGMETVYVYAALARGDYLFICEVHPVPEMMGTLRVR